MYRCEPSTFALLAGEIGGAGCAVQSGDFKAFSITVGEVVAKLHAVISSK